MRKTKKPARHRKRPLPVVDLSQPIPILAAKVGKILKAAPIYRFGDSIATIDASGKLEPMTPERFVTWIKQYVIFTLPGKGSLDREMMIQEIARGMLNSQN